VRTFSFGGGVQSMAVLVLAAMGKVQYDAFLFANVGDDSERAATLEYVERIAKPYAAANGLNLIELQRMSRSGEVKTLYGTLHTAKRSINIPVKLASGAYGNRNCTADFKIYVIAKWQKQHGATKANKAVCGLGITVDEIHRARTDSGIAWQTLEYPLLDLRMFRRDCVKVIQDAGLPVPPKSACWFCPFHNRQEWQRMKREEPDVFDKAVTLENMLNERREMLGKDRIFLHASGLPLAQIVGDQIVMDFPEDDMPCDTGHCFV